MFCPLMNQFFLTISKNKFKLSLWVIPTVTLGNHDIKKKNIFKTYLEQIQYNVGQIQSYLGQIQ